MSNLNDNLRRFERSPAVETRISVQFEPLLELRSGHFGLFWEDCLGTDNWECQEDLAPVPTEVERFGTKALYPPQDVEVWPQVRMRLQRQDGLAEVQFQANRLMYSWRRGGSTESTYKESRRDFEDLFERFGRFCERLGFGVPSVNFWEVGYVNVIPQGELWQDVTDWHQIFPALFPQKAPSPGGLRWGTFQGTWYFEMPDEKGRVHVRAQKSVNNRTDSIVLLMHVLSRGTISPVDSEDWLSRLDLGHKCANHVFYSLASETARRSWGELNNDQ